MGVANTQPVYPPYAGQPIDTAWGKAVSDSVVQPFTTIADRAAKWTSPPNGALSAVRNVMHIYQSSAWGVSSLFTDQVIVSNNRVGNNQPGYQALDTPVPLRNCPYPCVLQIMCDTTIWVSQVGQVDFQVYSQLSGAPNGAGWIARCDVPTLVSGQAHGQSVSLIDPKGDSVSPGGSNHIGAQYREGDQPVINLRHAFTTYSMGHVTHVNAVYLPTTMVAPG